jgi:hypothetical protein
MHIYMPCFFMDPSWTFYTTVGPIQEDYYI